MEIERPWTTIHPAFFAAQAFLTTTNCPRVATHNLCTALPTCQRSSTTVKKALGTFLLSFAATHLFAQVPYERWFQGIIYGSNGRVYADGSALLTGQFYPSKTFMVRTEEIGAPLIIRLPSLPGRFTQLQNWLFTPTGEDLLFNSSLTSRAQNGSALLSKWNTALDIVRAYMNSPAALRQPTRRSP